MLSKRSRTWVLGLIILLMAGCLVWSADSGSKLQDALYQEEIEGNLDAAIKLYNEVAGDTTARPNIAAQALYRLGLCYMKQQDEMHARQTMQTLVDRYPDQTAMVEKAQAVLNELISPDPAALMPEDTIAYCEIGNPGKQVETIVNMLKGTPLENPLALINGGQPQSGQSDPAVALFNPSMLNEFKKIRGYAAGFMGMTRDGNGNVVPNFAVVVFPGKSDALRGLLAAFAGMNGQPDVTIEGMSSIRIQGNIGFTYDNDVMILAQPFERLESMVKLYKGTSKKASLLESDPSFVALSRKQREDNLLSLWVSKQGINEAINLAASQGGSNIDPYSLKMINYIKMLADTDHADSLVAQLFISENLINANIDLTFSKDHQSLLYGLINTPNISDRALLNVPENAIAIMALGLNQADTTSSAAARQAVKRVTGLDIGRELFDNINQVSLFVVPPTPASNQLSIVRVTSPILPCLGLSFSSDNPQKTYQLFKTLMEVAEQTMKAQMEIKNADWNPNDEKYLCSELGNDGLAYWYLTQAGNSTILTMNPEIINAAKTTASTGKNVCNASVLKDEIKSLPPSVSKLVLINGSGAMGVAAAHLAHQGGNQGPVLGLLKSLAQLCPELAVRLCTIEEDNRFGLNLKINHIPAVSEAFPVIMQHLNGGGGPATGTNSAEAGAEPQQ